MAEQRISYGDHPAQHLELTRPGGTPLGAVVVLHGGFWKAEYDLSLGRPLVPSLVAQGWAVANVEYRRVGGGGGWPGTFDDVAAAVDALADTDLDLGTVVALGHSAGGHLAAWAAARGRFERWQPERVPVTHVVSQAGVLDLAAAERDQLGNGAVAALLGAPRPPADQVDPTVQLPLGVPLWCVHGRDDDIVPLSQSREYVARATGAGAQAELVEVAGDHFAVIGPETRAWRRTLELLDGM